MSCVMIPQYRMKGLDLEAKEDAKGSVFDIPVHIPLKDDGLTSTTR